MGHPQSDRGLHAIFFFGSNRWCAPDGAGKGVHGDQGRNMRASATGGLRASVITKHSGSPITRAVRGTLLHVSAALATPRHGDVYLFERWRCAQVCGDTVFLECCVFLSRAWCLVAILGRPTSTVQSTHASAFDRPNRPIRRRDRVTILGLTVVTMGAQQWRNTVESDSLGRSKNSATTKRVKLSTELDSRARYNFRNR